MSRVGNVLPTSSDFLNVEKAVNDLLLYFKSKNIVGSASNREVPIESSSATEITPTTEKTQLWICNDTGQTLRLGGSGVTTSTGCRIFNGQVFQLGISAQTSFYIIAEAGSGLSLDIIEWD